MIKNISKKLIVVLTCVILVTGAIVLEMFSKDKMQREDATELDTVETGISISSGKFENMIYEDEQLICYQDKIIFQFKIQQDNTTKIADRVKGVIDKCPKLENVYVMPVPNHVLINDDKKEQQKAYNQFITDLKKAVPEKTVVVDALPELKKHESEYIFFNTSDTWTATGAYYGMNVLGEAMGLDVISLDEYWEYSYNTFVGEMVLFDGLSEFDNISQLEDHVYYYLYPNSNNEVEIYKEEDNGEISSYKKPLITPSFRNTGAFIGSNYIKAIVEGKSVNGDKKGKYLLVVCDDTGKIITPFLKDYYDGVYVVSVLRDGDLYNEINEIVEKYNITDMLYIQNSMKMGNEGYSKALNSFCAYPIQ